MRSLVLLLPILFISACSVGPVADDPQFEYKQANVYKDLEVPPDLTIEQDVSYSIPGIDELNSAAPDYEDAKLVRSGSETWLEVTGDADTIWTRLHNFLNLQGIKIESSDKLTGLIKSEWLGNQTGIETGSLLENLEAQFVSENNLDQYIISVERNSSNKVKIVVLHNGLTKVVYDAKNNETSLSEQWIKTPTNISLSLTLLKKFMAYSGLSSKVNNAQFKQSDLSDLFKSKVIKQNNKDHFILIKKPSALVFNRIKNIASDHFDVEDIKEESSYILINEPYQSTRLVRKTTKAIDDINKDIIRIQIIEAGYSTKIVIRNDRGDAIDLATTNKLLSKLMKLYS